MLALTSSRRETDNDVQVTFEGTIQKNLTLSVGSSSSTANSERSVFRDGSRSKIVLTDLMSTGSLSYQKEVSCK